MKDYRVPTKQKYSVLVELLTLVKSEQFDDVKLCNYCLQELEHQDGIMDEERKEKAIKLVDAVARKFFIEEIGNKIDKGQKTSSDTLDQGLEQLRLLTSPFIHHYTGAVLQGLPPLRDFTIMFQPTALQEKMINKLQEKLGDKTMLERECLLSLVCIHPNLLLQHNVGRNLTDLLPQKVTPKTVCINTVADDCSKEI